MHFVHNSHDNRRLLVVSEAENVDLYVANHESADLLYEEQVVIGDTSSTLNESGQDFVQFRSLSITVVNVVIIVIIVAIIAVDATSLPRSIQHAP